MLHVHLLNELNEKNVQNKNMLQPCRNPPLKECEDEIHTPEMGTWESSRTLEISKLDFRGQNTSP